MGKHFKKKQSLLLILIVVFVLSAVSFAGGQPTDISGHWGEDLISDWYNKGMAKGYGDGTFKPDSSITRAEFAAMVNRAFNFTEAGTVSFPDVGANKWYAQDVAIASNAGYIAGYGDGTFKPDSNITRQEAAVMISRIVDLDIADLSQADGFTDADKMQQWGKGSIGAVNVAAIMQGYQDKSFRPDNPITRAESIATIDRAMKYEPGEVPEEPEVAGAIEGQVTLDDKGVKADVWIFAKDSIDIVKELETNKDGEFKVELDTGTYDITASTDTHVGYASDVKVTGDKVTQQDVELEEAAIVEGKLVDRNAKIVKNVDIFFTTNPTFIGRTNNSGEFSVPVLPDHNYNVCACESEDEDEPDSVEKGLGIGAAGINRLDDALVGPWGTSSGGGGGSSSVKVSALSVEGTGDATTISEKGGTLQMVAEVIPTNASKKAVTWSVENGTGKASIDQDGLLTAVKNGTVTVKATAKDGSGIFGTVVITISGQEVTVDKTALTAAINAEYSDGASRITYVLTDDYTVATWTAYTGAITAAIGVEADGDATQATVDAAAAAIGAAKNSLIKMYTLKYQPTTLGLLIGTGTQKVAHGGSGTPVEARPYPGYKFVEWNDGVTDNPRQDINVTGNIYVAPVFAAMNDAEQLAVDKALIEAGTYVIPLLNQSDQAAKTAWVQNAVNNKIQDITTGKTNAVVTWNTVNSKYDVALSQGALTDLANIIVTEEEKETPVVQGVVAATAVTVGQTLESSALSGRFKNADGVAVAGTLAWNYNTTVVNATGNFGWTFTPTDTVAYNVVTGTVEVVANPAPETYSITVQNDGNGTGSATPAPAAAGTEIALSATPGAGYEFDEWVVVNGGVTVSDNKFTMPANDVVVKAKFKALPPVYASTNVLANVTVLVANGTNEAGAKAALDATVGVVGTNSETGTATIAWTIASYDGNTAGEYTATGVLTLPEGWTGSPANVTATVTVQEEDNTPADSKSGITKQECGIDGSKQVTLTITVKNAAGKALNDLVATDFRVKVKSVDVLQSSGSFNESPFTSFVNTGDGTYTIVYTGAANWTYYTFTDLTAKGVIIEAGPTGVITPPGAAPKLLSATVSSDGTIITLAFDKAMYPPKPESLPLFSAVVDSQQRTFSAVELNEDTAKIDLTLEGDPVFQGVTVTVSYSGNFVQSTDLSFMDDITDQAVTNNSTVPGAF